MGLMTTVAVVAMVAVCLLVTGPLFFELVLSLADGLGYSGLRSTRAALAIATALSNLSDSAEYAVATATLGMITLPIYLHFVEFAPFWQRTHEHHDSLLHLLFLHLAPSIWINSNMLWHFYKASTTDAGRSEPDTSSTASIHICAVCRTPKPPRTHHCSTCKRCVRGLDHHCPFTANCVGAGNHHHFFLFIFYSWVATVYAVWLSYHPYAHCLSNEMAGDTAAAAANGDDEAHPCAEWRSGKPRLFYLSIGSCAVLSCFLGFISYLLATDQTTLEFITFSSPRRKREDLLVHYRTRGLLHHLRRLLGPVSYWWRYLLPFPAIHAAIPRGVHSQSEW